MVGCLEDAYNLLQVNQAASREEIDQAYAHVISRFPRGLLTEEVRDAYDAWSILTEHNSVTQQDASRGDLNSDVKVDQVNLQATVHPYQESKGSDVYVTTKVQKISVEDVARCNPSRNPHLPYHDQRDGEERRRKEKGPTDQTDPGLQRILAIFERPDELPATNHVVKKATKKVNNLPRLAVTKGSGLDLKTAKVSPLGASTSRKRSSYSRQFHTFWQWTRQHYGWAMEGKIDPRQQSVDSKLLNFLAIWLKESEIGAYVPTKLTDRAFLRLLLLACSQHDCLTVALADRFREAFELLDVGLSLRFASGLLPGKVDPVLTLVLVLGENQAGYGNERSQDSAKDLCLKLEVIAARLPSVPRQVSSCSPTASERISENHSSLRSPDHAAGTKKPFLTTRPFDDKTKKEIPAPADNLSNRRGRSAVSDLKIETHKSKKRQPSHMPLGQSNQTSNQASLTGPRTTTSFSLSSRNLQVSDKGSHTEVRRTTSVEMTPRRSRSITNTAARHTRPLRSRASSTNVSLRDGRRSSFDQDYQRPDFSTGKRGSATTSVSYIVLLL